MALEFSCIADIWSCMPFCVGYMVSIMVFMVFMVSIICGHQRDHLRHQRVQALHVRQQVLDVVGHRVDAVEGVEDSTAAPSRSGC